MFEVGDFFGDGVVREFLEHDVDVYEAVAAAVEQDDGRFDVAGGVFSDFVVSVAGAYAERGLHIVVIHLEALVSDDLEPVDDALGACE